MNIMEAVDLLHRAKTKVERAKRNKNVHDDIEIMDGLVTLVETLQVSLRASATAVTSTDGGGAT
jgi:hypothetical protein